MLLGKLIVQARVLLHMQVERGASAFRAKVHVAAFYQHAVPTALQPLTLSKRCNLRTVAAYGGAAKAASMGFRAINKP
jgi:hypothetical protein